MGKYITIGNASFRYGKQSKAHSCHTDGCEVD